MIVSWNWLSQYLRLDMPVAELTQRLALAGLNHESTEDVGGDLAVDLEVTSNRPDCLSHLGVAREVAVLYGKPLTEPAARPPEKGEPVEKLTSVQVEAPDLCPRFTARVVSGVRIGESPWWLRKRLETIGVRPISNVVDVTNYVMFECGQPLHAYDLDKLYEKRLVVRRARKGETLRAINNKVYELAPEMLVIADGREPVGLAGVMGGLATEIGEKTRNVLIEAAQFDPINVRRTSRALGLHSPSSFRFERGLDPERTEWASRRCAELILETAGGVLHPGVIDVGTRRPEPPRITLRLEQIERVLGIKIDRDRVISILRALGLEQHGELTFRPPSWRADLEREIDLIEEVARIHGYEQIPEDRPVPMSSAPRSKRERVESEVRALLAGVGLDEAVTLSLVDDTLVGLAAMPGNGVPPLRVEHSSRKREVNLRLSLAPSLLAARAHNQAHGTADAELFEIANVYLPTANALLPHEPARLAIVAGRDYYGMKAIVEALLDRLHVEGSLEAVPSSWPLLANGKQAELRLGGHLLGHIGTVAQPALDALELRGECAAAELSFDLLIERANLVPRYQHIPHFPAIARDLSLVVNSNVRWAELADVVTHASGPTLESLSYLDTFRGGNLPADAQSVHFGMRFRHPDRTLTSEEAEQAVQSVVQACAQRFGATLRA